MTLRAMRREEIRTGNAMLDAALRRLQDAWRDVYEPLLRIPLLDGTTLTDVALGTTFANIDHGLTRPWRGYILVGRTTDVRVWHEASEDESLHVRLRASASATVNLWVY